MGRRWYLALCLGAALGVPTAPAAAQAFQVPPNFGSGGVYREDPATALGRYLRMVTASPRNLEALTGAGRAALEVGDPQAAIGFYARAEAISPGNGRVKAGLGSALVLLNQEAAALRYFEEAVNLGVPEADIASDRGLAFDLRGSAKRAQRDYALALKRGPDPETTRRMALSLGISGERDAALALLDPLLRRQDTAAWRARAFVLAMTGDAAGASKTAESVMSPTLAAGFAPFFRKLPSLRPGEKAAAVHFGNFPGEGRPMRIDDLFNQAEVAARVALENTPRSALDAGSVDGTQVAFGRAPTRVPDAEGQVSLGAPPRAAAPRVAPVSTPRPNVAPIPAPRVNAVPAPRAAATVPTPTPLPAPRVNSGVATAGTIAPSVVNAVRAAAAAAAQATVTSPPATPAPRPAVIASAIPTPVIATPAPVIATRPADAPSASTAPLPGFGSLDVRSGPPPTMPVSAAPAPTAPARTAPGPTRLADISATVREVARAPLVGTTELPPSDVALPTLPADLPTGSSGTATAAPSPSEPSASLGSVLPAASPSAAGPRVEAPSTAAPPAPRPKVELAARPSPAPESKPEATVGESSRIWVQVAGGADEKLFAAEWRRLKGQAPDLLTTRTAWTTPLKATNRLLVGPFDSQRDAQDFVNKLAPKGITAFAWTSAQGQAITKLATR